MRTLVLLSLSLVLIVSACGDDKKETTAPAAPAAVPAVPAETPVPAAEPKVPVKPEPAVAPGNTAAPGDDDCVAACVQRNQMRAVGPDQIQRDCEADCTQ